MRSRVVHSKKRKKSCGSDGIRCSIDFQNFNQNIKLNIQSTIAPDEAFLSGR